MEVVLESQIPKLLPVLPVRNTVVFPNAAIPLIVGRSKSIKAIQKAQKADKLILVVSQKDGIQDSPRPEELHRIGTVCRISKVVQMDKDGLQLVASGICRFAIKSFVTEQEHLQATGAELRDVLPENTALLEALKEQVGEIAQEIVRTADLPGGDALQKLLSQTRDAGQLADFCCTFLGISLDKKQQLLETLHLQKRLETLLELMLVEKEKLQLRNEIQAKMADRIGRDQRDQLLREQLRTIHEELGSEGQDKLLEKIETSEMSEEAKKVALEEQARLASTPKSSPEYHVIRSYLDWLLTMPWKNTSATSPEEIDLKAARATLDQDHYGIERVKRRIIQFLSVSKLKKDMRGPILCLVGPPGVGKTSIGQSIATALGRKFIKTSLGGVHDEAEIRGHRRTYIGSMPGRIIQNLKRSGVKDPMFMLDEVDKIGNDFRGDPASALLEVLDPEQNHAFLDHYLDVPFDLSRVFFITTANVVDTIPPALRDRLEIIEMTSYSPVEKRYIALKYLFPKALEDHGIKPSQIELPEETVDRMIETYTHEAGVRELNRKLSELLRGAAEIFANPNPPEKISFTPESLTTYLGSQRFFPEILGQKPKTGVVTGLAWTEAGGEILQVEATRLEGSGELLLTGQLGEVMKESAQIALSLARTILPKPSFKFEKSDFHIHVPAGSIPKDGPSAGVAIFLALASLIQKQKMDPKIAVTGEITLTGRVLPVGGIKEKVLAAHRAGVSLIFLPEKNKGDLKELSTDVLKSLNFHWVSDITDCQPLYLTPPPARPTLSPLETGAPH